jgi:hypothetical protein
MSTVAALRDNLMLRWREHGSLTKHLHDGPENFAERIRSLQQNVTWQDSQRNAPIFYNQLFDLRSNGGVKRVGLILWALPLLVLGMSACASALSHGSFVLAVATCLLLGAPSFVASAAAIWTACFLRAPLANHRVHRHHGHH